MSQSGIYNEAKMAWWWAREHKLPDAPKSMQVVLSDTCQQNCHFCAYRMDATNEFSAGRQYTSNELFTAGAELSKYGTNNPIRQIPTDRAMSLLDEFKRAGVLSIEWTGGGEPLLQKDHEAIFSRALELGFKCSLVSNGVSMKQNLIDNILPRFMWIRVSIDAGTKESYTKLRNCAPGHWDVVWRNIRNLSDSIKSCNSNTTFGLGFVVTPHSYKEIPEFVARAKEYGVANVRLTAMFSSSDERPFIPIYDEIHGLICEARKLTDGNFSVYDNFKTRFEDLEQHRPDFPSCPHQYYVGYVGGDLKAYRCCLTAYSRHGLIRGGDLSKRPFDEFWNSQERKDDLANLRPPDCERCQFSGKIKSLLYISGETSSDTIDRHLEFP